MGSVALDFSNLPLATRNDLYYLEPIVFQVEDSLFKVPQYHFFRGSEVFRDMLSVSQYPEGERDGSCDSKPLFLGGVSKVDFQRLLKVMYPLVIALNPSHSKDEWVSILKLSTMWWLNDIRKLAVDQLTKLNLGPIEQIVLAKEYKVPQWLQASYRELATRHRMMTDEEAQKIGYPTTIQVWHLREEYWKRAGSGDGFDEDRLEIVFAEELKEVRAANAEYT